MANQQLQKIIRELGFKVFDSDKEVKKALTKKDLINQIYKEFKSKIPDLIKKIQLTKLNLENLYFLTQMN